MLLMCSVDVDALPIPFKRRRRLDLYTLRGTLWRNVLKLFMDTSMGSADLTVKMVLLRLLWSSPPRGVEQV